MTRLVRSFPSGARVHRSDCARAGKTVPWDFAENLPDDEWLKYGWLKPCRYCLPDQAARQDEARARAQS